MLTIMKRRKQALARLQRKLTLSRRAGPQARCAPSASDLTKPSTSAGLTLGLIGMMVLHVTLG